MSKSVSPTFYLERIVNASPFSNQTPTIDNAGFYYDQFAVNGPTTFTATGMIRGIPDPHRYSLLVLARDEQNRRWYSGPKSWLAEIDADGGWRLTGITTTALTYAAVLMTPEFFASYASSQFPQGENGFVAELPTAATNPGDVILQITFPPGFNRVLLVDGQPLPPGHLMGGGELIAMPSAWGPNGPNDPLSLTGADLQKFFVNWRSGSTIAAAGLSGEPTGWAVKLGFYAQYLNEPLYFLAMAGLDSTGPAPVDTPVIRGLQIGNLGAPGGITADELNAGLTITVLADNFEIKIVSVDIEPSMLELLEQTFEQIGKLLFKILLRCAKV